MAPAGSRTDHGPMQTLTLILVPFGFFALLAGAGAACAGVKAASADDAGRRLELWGMCAALTLVALLCAGAAWWWWAGWSNFSF
jgi:hypothetical protein